MENILNEFEETNVIYGSFWQRFLALLIDGLILFPVFLFDWYNKTSLKSSALLILVTFLSIAYKPFMEFRYGSTVGKKVLKLKVVNNQFMKASLSNILFRNVFDITEKFIVLIIVLIVFNMPEFQLISSLDDFTNLQDTVLHNNWILYPPLVIVLVEIIFLLSDQQRRSLHDRIGSTLVVKS